MDRRNIYIIFDKEKFDKDFIIAEIKAEGYTYKFVFDTGEHITELIKYSDEVWSWGDCKNNPAYTVAKDLRKEIWVMG